MRALQVQDHSEKPVFLPTLAANQILIRTAACALNFADLLMIRGTYQETPALPFTLGMEVAGEVAGLGAEVTGFEIGDRVAGFAGSGGLAEYCPLEATRCLKLTDGMSFDTAASALISYGTSHLALTHRAKLTSADTLLVLGAGGGVGLTAVEIGAALGARVIAVARGPEKLQVCKDRGAAITIDSAEEDVVAKVKSLGGVNVVYDPVGGDPFVQIKANHLLVKNVDVLGFYWGGYMGFAPQVLLHSLRDVFAMISKGQLNPHIGGSYDFDQALEALADLKARKSIGKLVVRGPV